jgi:SAM-dependent methyltransferase
LKLKLDQVAFHPFSQVDWSGRVFSWEGGLYRAISGERAPFYQHLLSGGILRDLIRRQLLIDTEISDLELDGYAFVLKHRTLPFVSHCYEWCGEMLKAAALAVLELEKELLKHGLTLQDAHPYNVLFAGPMPVWVDLGSVVPDCPGEPWHAHEEFLAYYTRPLKIMAAGHSGIARSLLRNGGSELGVGVQQRDLEAITGITFADMIKDKATAGIKTVAREAFPSKLQALASRATRSIARSLPFGGTRETISVVDNAIQEIESIRLVQPSTIWSDGYGTNFPDFVTTTHWTIKHRSVAQILVAKKPGSVLDIGSNRGWYSQLTARNGAQVVSVDRNESWVTKLFFDAVTSQLPILPLVADFRTLNPMMAWAAAPGIAYADRLRCDMVLALALVHVLVFEQHLNFDLIVRGLSAFATKCLAVEFFDRDDRYVREQLGDQFSWYNFENFLTALRREFREVTKFDSDEQHRWVLLCER